jgi:hypothetical protein
VWLALKRNLSILFIFSLIIILLISFNIPAQADDDYFKIIESKYSKDKGIKFRESFEIESPLPDEVFEVKIYFFKDNIETKNDTSIVDTDPWKYQLDISKWVAGDYDVTFIAQNSNHTKIGKEKTITIVIESPIPPGTDPGSIFDTEFVNKYKGNSFTDKFEMSQKDLDNIDTIQIIISKENKDKIDKTIETSKNSWDFEAEVKDWDTGTYDVVLLAFDPAGVVIDSTSFQIKIKEEDKETFFTPLFCAIILIIFIVLFIVLFILTIIKHKKIMAELRFDPKTVVKKLPMMAFMSMLITFLLVISGTAVVMTAELGLITFLIFLVGLGLLMLVTYWVFSNRNYPNFMFYLIFSIISLIVISLAALWSPTDALGLVVGSGLMLTAFILFFISIFLYWLTSRRGFLIALVAMFLSLAFCIIHIVFIALSLIEFVDWWIAQVVGSVLLIVMLLISWLVLREDIFFFETRDESKTHRGWRRTLNMFDILSTPRGLMNREYDRKVMGKISYEQLHDKNVRMEVIQLREWDTVKGRAQGRRLMGVFVNKMRSKEGPMFNKEPVAESVKYSTYSSDTNLDDKLKLCKAFGFQIQDSGKERGLDYYDLELVQRPFLGLGTPMGSRKKKKDYDKDSGYARDKDKEKDDEREHKYDYEYEEDRRREKRERESRASYDRDRSRERERTDTRRDRDRHRDEEPDEDVEDWSSRSKSRGSDRDYDRGRDRDFRREPEPEKTKKRPPPPKIIAD